MKLKNIIFLLFFITNTTYIFSSDADDSDDEEGSQTQLVYQTYSPTHKSTATKKSSTASTSATATTASSSVRMVAQPVQVINPKMSGIFVTSGAELTSDRQHISYDDEETHGTAPKAAVAALAGTDPEKARQALSSAELHHVHITTVMIQRASSLPFKEQMRLIYGVMLSALLLKETKKEVTDPATNQKSFCYKTKKNSRDSDLKDFLQPYRLACAFHYTNRKAIGQIEAAEQKEHQTEENRLSNARRQLQPVAEKDVPKTLRKTKVPNPDAPPKSCGPTCATS